MVELLLILGAFAFLCAGWLWMYSMYRKIYHVKVKWWAIPFCHGALFWATRLPAKWEK